MIVSFLHRRNPIILYDLTMEVLYTFSRHAHVALLLHRIHIIIIYIHILWYSAGVPNIPCAIILLIGCTILYICIVVFTICIFFMLWRYSYNSKINNNWLRIIYNILYRNKMHREGVQIFTRPPAKINSGPYYY